MDKRIYKRYTSQYLGGEGGEGGRKPRILEKMGLERLDFGSAFVSPPPPPHWGYPFTGGFYFPRHVNLQKQINIHPFYSNRYTPSVCIYIYIYISHGFLHLLFDPSIYISIHSTVQR